MIVIIVLIVAWVEQNRNITCRCFKQKLKWKAYEGDGAHNDDDDDDENDDADDIIMKYCNKRGIIGIYKKVKVYFVTWTLHINSLIYHIGVLMKLWM